MWWGREFGTLPSLSVFLKKGVWKDKWPDVGAGKVAQDSSTYPMLMVNSSGPRRVGTIQPMCVTLALCLHSDYMLY